MNFPKHQKIMDEWVSIASKFHREIEKMLKAKKHHLLDLDKNNVVTQEEIKKATEVLEKARRKEQKREQLRNLNNFMMRV